jgi:acyl-CoA thioester hydrolase
MSSYKAPIRCLSHSFIVPYAETDQMGVVYHSNYLRWFEIGRTDLLRALGHQYRQWESDRGVYLPVLNATLQFQSPARYDDWIAVEATLTRLTAASVEFHYSVHRVPCQQAHQLIDAPLTAPPLATGTTRHAFVDREGKVRRMAAELLPEVFAHYRMVAIPASTTEGNS